MISFTDGAGFEFLTVVPFVISAENFTSKFDVSFHKELITKSNLPLFHMGPLVISISDVMLSRFSLNLPKCRIGCGNKSSRSSRVVRNFT